MIFGVGFVFGAEPVWRSAMDSGANASVGAHGLPQSFPIGVNDMYGNAGGAVWFDGANDYFNLGKQGVSNLTAGTISAWVRPDSVAGENGVVAVGASGGGEGTDKYFSFQNSNSSREWRADVDDGANRYDAYSDAVGVTGKWEHIVATFTAGSDLSLYVDGVLQSDVPSLTAHDPGGFVPNKDWVVGAERIDGRHFMGAIDDVRIYTNEIDQADVTALYNAGPRYALLYDVCTLKNTNNTYDASLVTVAVNENVIGPADGTEWGSGAVQLGRFDSGGWNGFSLASGNGTVLNEEDFDRGYLEFTIEAKQGILMDLEALSFLSARGGTSGTRYYELYAAVNGAAFAYGDTPIDTIADETGTRDTPRPVRVDLSGSEYQASAQSHSATTRSRHRPGTQWSSTGCISAERRTRFRQEAC